MFYKIVWKSFKGNIRKFLAFFLSGVISISSLYIVLFAYELVKKIPAQALIENSGRGLGVLYALIPSLILISAVVSTYSLQFYIRGRIKEYALLSLLGIKKRDMRKVLIMEYTIACVVSCLVGIIGGRVATSFLGRYIRTFIGENFNTYVSMERLYKGILLLCAGLIISTLFGVSILLAEKSIGDLIKTDLVKDKEIHPKKSFLCFIVSVVVILISFGVMLWWDGEAGTLDSLCFSILSVGIFILINFGLDFIRERRIDTKKHYQNLLKDNLFYYRIRKNLFMISIQTILSVILLMFTFKTLPSIELTNERVYPNDFLCLYNSDENFAERFAQKYQGKQTEIPIVWITSKQTPPMLGIPISSYNKMYGKNETLRDDEIISLFSDRGWSLIENKNTKMSTELHFEQSFHPETTGKGYHVKEERTEDVLGFTCDMVGVVLLEDEEFVRIRELTKMNDSIALLHVNDEELLDATEFVENDSKVEKAFCKVIESRREKSEIIFGMIILGILDITLLFFGFFIMWLNVYANMEVIERKYIFLTTLGMKKRDCKNSIQNELLFPFKIQLILTVILATLCCGVQVTAQMIHGTNFNSLSFHVKELAILLIVYIVAELIFMYFVQRRGVNIHFLKDK